jgi:transposase, IS30 family
VIAGRLGKAVSTVSREVAANGGRDGYRAWRAHQRAREQARRPEGCKLARPELAAQVTSWLHEWWSPVQISRRLRIEFPGDPMMHVSHETIYQALYVQGRGELRRELARCLRSGRAWRRPRGRDGRSGHIMGMVMISERPAEAQDRAVPGHWEGDLIIGKDCKSAAGTLVERTTRYVMLLHLPGGRDARLVEQAMRQAITALPAELARTITWDQGIEMARGGPLELHYTPKHGSWLNMAEIELAVLASQCLDRRLADRATLEREVMAWQAAHNHAGRGVDWRFTTEDARIKLKHLYPTTQD